MIWRVLPFEHHRAAMNMAIDEAICSGVGEQRSPPTIRFYGWTPSAVSIGCFQNILDEVDVEECRRQGVEVVRRRTGGGTVFHDHAGEVTYSVIAPELEMGKDILASYRRVCGWVIDALNDVGIAAEFKPINDITVNGRKVSGCAQTRRGGAFLQHGTVLHSIDTRRMFSLLRVDREKLADKGLASAEERVTSVSKLSNCTRDDLLSSLQRGFLRDKKFINADLTSHEVKLALELARSRYDDRDWTYSR
jgi:lipoate---protein ligase